MQTSILPQLLDDNPDVQISEQVLRSCVHCGFCNATCPTYLLTGNELEGPRGRIYLIKSVLEGRIGPGQDGVVAHIDNCLGCLACETTCPSGVVYSRLLEEVRPRLEEMYRRPLADRLVRFLLIRLLPYPKRFRWAVRLGWLGRIAAPLMPRRLRHLIELAPTSAPSRASSARTDLYPAADVADRPPLRRVALLTGCVQEVMGAHINDATIRLLNKRGVDVVIPDGQGCCGALTYHMGERRQSLQLMARNIQVWHDEIEHRALDAIVLNTSGCATAVKEYGHIFRNDPALAEKAAAVVERVRDLTEVIDEIGLGPTVELPALRVAYHDACSLQHGQQICDPPRRLLTQAGFQVLEVPEGHICCGSAGTYNLLRPHLADRLQRRKTDNIKQIAPQVVAAGNIGCIEQIARGVDVPVVHTVELLDWATGGPRPSGIDPELRAP
jgi:glycolate oxidase iron-sulfur subunit